MPRNNKTSKYVGVSFIIRKAGQLCQMKWDKLYPWKSSISFGGKVLRKSFPTEREAAIQYDKWVLNYQLDRPLNILKPKLCHQ